MVESTTQHYGWTKPEVTKSASTWGGFLNTDLDSIDSLVFANQQGIVPIGSITMFGGATAPANWLLCQGQSLDTTTYAGLFAVFQYVFGGSGPNFNLPNLTQKFPIGAGTTALGAAGGASSVALATANLPAHAHPITDVAHNHGVNQWAHAHGIATGGHSHGIHTGGHSHSIDHLVLSNTGGGNASAGAGWAFVSANASAVGDLGGNTDAAGNLGGNTDAQTSAISNQASGTGLSTTQNAGSGTPVPLPLPPFVAINFIVRYA